MADNARCDNNPTHRVRVIIAAERDGALLLGQTAPNAGPDAPPALDVGWNEAPASIGWLALHAALGGDARPVASALELIRIENARGILRIGYRTRLRAGATPAPGWRLVAGADALSHLARDAPDADMGDERFAAGLMTVTDRT